MGSFFDSGPLPDWKLVQQWLGRDLPWKLVEQWDKQGNSSWLNDYVQQMMDRSRQEAKTKAKAKGLRRMDIRKDAKHVAVTLALDPEIDLRRLQLFATSDRLRVTGLPNDGKQSIRFPCLVYPRSGRTVVKQGQLVARFRRRPPDKSEYELFIAP
ncbi:hypothetical protein [Cohnella sp. GCM10027633]|uniref:hypothetical protein n=1 Tax=unclassified Cohnella TaxID=2636738 RepID=UPI00363252EB